MTDSGFRSEEYKHLASMKLDHYEDTCLGMAPETLTCVLHILGVSEVPAHLRGYAEALGAGIRVNEGDLILRGSRYKTDEKGNLLAPCANPEDSSDRLNPEGKALTLKDESGKAYCKYYPIGDYRSILVFPGKASQIGSLKTFPPSSGFSGAKAPAGIDEVAKAFEYFRKEGQCIVPWGESVVTPVKSSKPGVTMPEKSSSSGIGKAAVITGTTVVRGIAKLLEMELLEVKGATGDVDTSLENKALAALEAAKDFPMVILHINGADEASHRKDPEEKYAFLHKVDEKVIAKLLASDHEIRVISDHGTDPLTGAHTGEKQPVFVNGVISSRKL